MLCKLKNVINQDSFIVIVLHWKNNTEGEALFLGIRRSKISLICVSTFPADFDLVSECLFL